MQGRVADWVRRVTRAAVCGSSRDFAWPRISARCCVEKDTGGSRYRELCNVLTSRLLLIYTLYTASWRSAAGSSCNADQSGLMPTTDQGGHSVTRLTHGETSSHAEWDREGVSSPPFSRQGSRSPPPALIACDTAHHSPSPPSRRGRRRGRRRSHYHATTLRRPAPPIPKTAIESHMRVQLQPSGSLSPRRIASS